MKDLDLTCAVYNGDSMSIEGELSRCVDSGTFGLGFQIEENFKETSIILDIDSLIKLRNHINGVLDGL